MSQRENFWQKCVRLAVLISLVAASALAAQGQVVFSPPMNISNSSGNMQAQQVAVDSSGHINVVWADNSLGNYAIFFSRSSDAGATFSTPRSISKHAQSTASGTQIAVDSAGNIDVVWTATDPSGQFNFVYFSRSADGVTFTNPQNISGDAGAATGPRIAVESGGGIDLVWVDTSLGNSEIFFSRSTDGAAFSTPLNISNDAGDSITPAIAVDPSGNINVAWADSTPGFFYDAFFSRSSDGGASFSSALQVTRSSRFVFAKSPTVASGANGNIYVLWIEHNPLGEGPDFARSTDGGATFSTIFAFRGPQGSRGPQMMAIDPSGSDIGVVAGTINEEDTVVQFRSSADSGASFTSAFGPFGQSISQFPGIVIDAIGRFDITYAFTAQVFGPPQTPCLCFAQSADGNEFSGASIASVVPLGPSMMALDGGGNVYVAWLQGDTSGGNANVFFSRGTVPPFSFSVSPTRVVEGSSSTGKLKLVTPAPAGGAVISLSSSKAVSMPASVSVPAGASSATFSLSANPVSRFTSTAITASLNGSANTVDLAVEPLFGFALFFGNLTGGNTAQGGAFLSQPAPTGGLVISLSSSNTSVASVPASVTIPAGSEGSVSFNITTSPVTAPTTVQITGTSNGFTHSVSFTVQPASLQQLTVSPTTATGGASSTGTVTLNGPAAAGGAVVSLSSSNPPVLSVPATVTIPQGSQFQNYTLTTSPVTVPTSVTLTAFYNGVMLSRTITVNP